MNYWQHEKPLKCPKAPRHGLARSDVLVVQQVQDDLLRTMGCLKRAARSRDKRVEERLKKCGPSTFDWSWFSRFNDHGGYVGCKNCGQYHWVAVSKEEGAKRGEKPRTSL